MPAPSPRLAVPAMFLAALLWSTGGVLIKSVDLPPLALAGYRSLIAALVLVLFTGLPGLPRTRLQVSAAVAYACTVVLFVAATKLTTAANAILLQFTAPIHVALLSPWLLGEPTSRRDWITIVCVMGGITLFFLDHLSPTGLLGNILALGSGVGFAFMIILLRKQRGAKPIRSVVQGNLLAMLCCLPWMLQYPPQSGTELLHISLLGVFQLGLPFLLYTWAVQHVGAVTAVLAPILEPLFNPVWVLLLVGERPGPYALVGAAVVIGAIAARGLVGILTLRNTRRIVGA